MRLTTRLNTPGSVTRTGTPCPLHVSRTQDVITVFGSLTWPRPFAFELAEGTSRDYDPAAQSNDPHFPFGDQAIEERRPDT